MKEAFEKIIEKLLEKRDEAEKNMELSDVLSDANAYGGMFEGFDKAIEIVKQEAEQYNNGWIPVSERLPNEAYGCLVTVMDCEPSTQAEFENILPYFVGYDGETWNDADGEEIPFEVVAWQPLPDTYQPVSNDSTDAGTRYEKSAWRDLILRNFMRGSDA